MQFSVHCLLCHSFGYFVTEDIRSYQKAYGTWGKSGVVGVLGCYVQSLEAPALLLGTCFAVPQTQGWQERERERGKEKVERSLLSVIFLICIEKKEIRVLENFLLSLNAVRLPRVIKQAN